jgi:hypothetical protein
LQAADGSAAERTRFRSAISEAVPVLSPLTGADLGQVFGRDTVVHVALAPGRLASSIAIDAGRLAGLTTRREMKQTDGRATASLSDDTESDGRA